MLITSLLICFSFVKVCILGTFKYRLNEWTLINQLPSADFRLQGGYDENAKNNDCIYIGSRTGDYYCFDVKTNTSNIIASGQNSIYNSAYQSSAHSSSPMVTC